MNFNVNFRKTDTRIDDVEHIKEEDVSDIDSGDGSVWMETTEASSDDDIPSQALNKSRKKSLR